MAGLLQVRNVSEEARRVLKVLDRAARRAERSPISAVEALSAARAEREQELMTCQCSGGLPQARCVAVR